MKKNLLALFLSSLAVASLRADLIFTETFPYTNGPIGVTGTNADGTTNWFVHSGLNDDFVNNQKLEIATTSGPLGRSGDVHRNFLDHTGTAIVVYGSFTVNCTNLPTAAGYFAHF